MHRNKILFTSAAAIAKNLRNNAADFGKVAVYPCLRVCLLHQHFLSHDKKLDIFLEKTLKTRRQHKIGGSSIISA